MSINICSLEMTEISLPEDQSPYEQLIVTRDPMFTRGFKAVEIVVKFIADNKLILYGGMAVDFALRLKGGFLYSDDINYTPDYDFYSPTSINHAYELTDILYDAGYDVVRAIAGVHTSTQRVDIGDNHFLADISYVPQKVFDIMPYLEYKGVRSIHPWYQLIDMHSAMSFLYDEPPRENVFNRLLKDLKRSDILLKTYPIVPPAYELKQWPTTRVQLRKHVLTGQLAYAFYYRLCEDKKPGMIPASFKFDELDQVIFAGPIEIVSHNMARTINELKLNGKYYKPLFNLQPRRYCCGGYTIYSTADKLLSIVSTYVDGRPFRLVCFQYLLRHFMATYYETNNPMYLAYYKSCLDMIPEDPRDTPFYISTEYYGSDNKSASYKKDRAGIDNAIKGTPLEAVPASYNPGRMIEKNGTRKHPTIPEGVHDFDVDGSPELNI